MYLLVMELRFDAMLYSNMGNENSDAGHIKCSRGPRLGLGPQVPHPWCKASVFIAWSVERKVSPYD